MIKHQFYFLSFIFICSIGGCSGLEVQAVTQPEPMEEPILNPQTPDMQQPESVEEPALQRQASESRWHWRLRVKGEIWRKRDPSDLLDRKFIRCGLGAAAAGALAYLGVAFPTAAALGRRFPGLVGDGKIGAAAGIAGVLSFASVAFLGLNFGYCRKPVREVFWINKETQRVMRDMKSSAKGSE